MKTNTLNLIYSALGSVIIAICSWISFPLFGIPLTLQTFAVFCVITLFGERIGLFSIIIYILLGTVGIPVFAGFSSGLGYILSNTGGYIVGFIFIDLIYWLFTKLFGKKTFVEVISLIIGLAVCYAFGTLWFAKVCTSSGAAKTIYDILSICVLPFVVPDLVKMILALLISKRLKPYIKI